MRPFKEKEAKFLKFSEHARGRSMWKGSRTVSENSYWVLKDKKFIRQNISISEALLKCFDEILVNAIDQYIEIAGYPEEVGGDAA